MSGSASSASVSFTGAVLTGGRSRRMGADKAFVVAGDGVLALRPLVALQAAGAAEVLSIGGDRARLAGLGYDARPDLHPGAGPLGGILGALQAATHDLVLVWAVDQPWLDASMVHRLVATLASHPEADVVALALDRRLADGAVEQGRRQLLAAAYGRSAAASLGEAFAAGERSVERAAGAARVEELHVVERGPVVDLWDLDSPADVERYAAEAVGPDGRRGPGRGPDLEDE